MLILSRSNSKNELVIGHSAEITIKVLQIKPNQVRLGIEAPPDTPVYRKEVYLKLKQQ